MFDPSKYPLSSKPGLSENDQALIDSINLDTLRGMIRDGEEMNDRQRKILAELEEKHSLRMKANSASASN